MLFIDIIECYVTLKGALKMELLVNGRGQSKDI